MSSEVLAFPAWRSREKPEDRRESYYPSSADDVFTAALCLQHKLGQGDSNLAAHILNLARYWQRSTSVRAEQRLKDEHIPGSGPREACLISEPVSGPGRYPIRGIFIRITANSLLRTPLPDEEDKTQVNMQILRCQRLNDDLSPSATEPQNDYAIEGAERPIQLKLGLVKGISWNYISWEYIIQRNRLKSSLMDSRFFGYLQTLQAGDRLLLVRPPEWRAGVDLVSYGQIDMYTSCLRASSFDD